MQEKIIYNSKKANAVMCEIHRHGFQLNCSICMLWIQKLKPAWGGSNFT